MTTTIATVTQTLTSQNYTLPSGDEINVTTIGASANHGDAIYTTFSPTNDTTIGGATIVIDATGIVFDGSSSANTDEYGIQSRGAADATLDNFGTITATTLTAVGFNDGKIINEAGGTITGGTFGIKIGGGALSSTIINAGTITAKFDEAISIATYSAPNAMISNSGLIIGDTAGTVSSGVMGESGIVINSGTVINAGTISQGHAGGYSVLFTGTSAADSLVLIPGEVEKGIDKTVGTLGSYITLAGTALGSLSTPGNYVGWTLASVAAGADWKIGGTSVETFGAGLGTIDISHGAGALGGGTLTLSGSLDSSTGAPITINMGGGAPSFGQGSTLNLTGSFLPNDSILANPITNFGTFDTIILPGFASISGDSLFDSYNTGTGILTVYEASVYGNSLRIDEEDSMSVSSGQGTLNTGNFNIFFNPQGLIITDAPCFAAGTRILTPDGEVAVENIVPGQEVLTAREGSETVAEVIWVGQRTIDLARHAMPEKVRPVRILAGAFGPGLPERDLRVSPDHALYIDGHLIEAKTLVNGVTVIVEQNTRYVTYHHIELARHDVVLAEGLPAETYLESGNRMMFESDARPMVLHPDFAAVSRKNACAPLLHDGRIVTAARQRLLDRALALGFAVTGDVDLMVRAGLERIKPEPDLDGELLFVLPAGAKDVQLLSGTGVPAEVSADPGDRRVLGVAVTGLTLIANGKRQEIPLNDAAHDGFHDMEAGHRWTKGAARISLPPYSGRAVLEVTIHGQARRWSSVASRQLG
jgi:hypothetical protein